MLLKMLYLNPQFARDKTSQKSAKFETRCRSRSEVSSPFTSTAAAYQITRAAMVTGSGSMATTSFLRNRYWVLRHGRSIPNERGLIVSSLENGILEEYQLAPEGILQAKSAGEIFLKELEDVNVPVENVRICYSPFARTTHTARTVASVLNIPFDGPQCKIFEDLRERYFGPSYELQSHEKYPEIWALDERDPFQKPEEGGESAGDVVSRLIRAMEHMDTEYSGCAILVVSHGDPLQMLQNILKAAKEHAGPDSNSITQRLEAVKVPSVLSAHRRFALETGELRSIL